MAPLTIVGHCVTSPVSYRSRVLPVAVAMSSLSFSLAPSLVRQQQLLGFSLGLATGAAIFLHHKLLLWRLSADSAAALSHQPPPARESYQVNQPGFAFDMEAASVKHRCACAVVRTRSCIVYHETAVCHVQVLTQESDVIHKVSVQVSRP